jgi:hypothetical protein
MSVMALQVESMYGTATVYSDCPTRSNNVCENCTSATDLRQIVFRFFFKSFMHNPSINKARQVVYPDYCSYSFLDQR